MSAVAKLIIETVKFDITIYFGFTDVNIEYSEEGDEVSLDKLIYAIKLALIKKIHEIHRINFFSLVYHIRPACELFRLFPESKSLVELADNILIYIIDCALLGKYEQDGIIGAIQIIVMNHFNPDNQWLTSINNFLIRIPDLYSHFWLVSRWLRPRRGNNNMETII